MRFTTSPLIIRLSALLLLCTVALHSAATESKTLLVFGDSLSAAYGFREEQGWVNLLAEKLDREAPAWTVVNASVSGETTAGGLARLPAALAAHEPDVVILELGGNDGLRGLPLASIKANLTEMVNLAQDAGARVLLAGIQIPPNYGPRYTDPFFDLFGDIAEAEGTAYLPFLIDGIAQQTELMQSDGIHPRARAQPMIVDNVWPVLRPMLKQPQH